jgi:hypothetical protein
MKSPLPEPPTSPDLHPYPHPGSQPWGKYMPKVDNSILYKSSDGENTCSLDNSILYKSSDGENTCQIKHNANQNRN